MASFLAMATVAALLSGAQAGGDIRITYAQDGEFATETFDLLVIACDPRDIASAFEVRSEKEQRASEAMQSFTMGTSLWDVHRKGGQSLEYSMRMHSDILAATDGRVYGIRDEPRARTGRTSKHTLVTAYQFDDKVVTHDEMMSLASTAMNGESDDYDWLGIEDKPTLLEVETTNYFPHFSQADIQAGLPWDILDAQGEYNTLYVSSASTFESVLAVYEYGNMLENTTQVQDAFEFAKDARDETKVAIIGAGPSGILFASQQLKRAGLTDFTIFEKEDEVGGKTHTYYYRSPGYPNKDKIPAELGTCYLGNTYAAFAEMLTEQYGVLKPVRISFGEDDTSPRGIVSQATGEFVPYNLWILERPDGTQMTDEEFAVLLGTYLVAHFSLAGWSMDTGIPMPYTQPADIPDMSFLEFLESIGVGDLYNTFQYAYSVQGYGEIGVIPAYYGLIWVMPDIFTGVMDVAASATERMALAAEDAETGLRLNDSAKTLRRGSKVARRFKKSAAATFEKGVRPSMEETAAVMARCHEDVLTETEEEEEEEEEGLDNVYLIQEGYGRVWDMIIEQEQMEDKIKLGVTVMKIERSGIS